MWAFAIVVSVMSVIAMFMADATVDDNRADTSRSRTVAESMATYRMAVVDMARANPTFEGSVNEAELSLPTWWQVRPGLKAMVEGRMVAVYVEVNDEQGDVLQEMMHLSAGSILVGIANQSSGTLHSPSTGDTGIPVPTGVPDGSPVWLATRD